MPAIVHVAPVPAEIEPGKVAMRMLAADVIERSEYAATALSLAWFVGG
jgi:hypothetical protein